MKVFDRDPKDWRDLQILVAQLFREMDCEASVEVPVSLVRGETKKVDVLVHDNSREPKSVYIIECKHWKRHVKQEVVHAFRTVVSDQNAHQGFIISQKGFQRGAHQAINSTNIKLCTFADLQTLFFNRWKAAMAKHYLAAATALVPFRDPVVGILPNREFELEDNEVFEDIDEAYRPLLALTDAANNDGDLSLPMTVPVLDICFKKVDELTLSTYREFYEWISRNAHAAIDAYRRHLGYSVEIDKALDDLSLPKATDAIRAGEIPAPPLFNEDYRRQAQRLAAEAPVPLRLHEVRLSSKNMHRGLHLRFVQEDDETWHALRDEVRPDGTAWLTTIVNGAIFVSRDCSFGELEDFFLCWHFDGQLWKLALGLHMQAYEDELNQTQADFEID